MTSADELWPLPVREAAEVVFGGAIHNPKGRMHKALDRRIRHALAVWRDRYEGLNPAQLEYAGQVLSWCIKICGNAEKPYPYGLRVVENIVNNARVHEGMKRRSDYVQVDVKALLS